MLVNIARSRTNARLARQAQEEEAARLRQFSPRSPSNGPGDADQNAEAEVVVGEVAGLTSLADHAEPWVRGHLCTDSGRL